MLKVLIEKRNAAIEAMNALIATAETEKRAFTEEEERSYDDYKKEIASLDRTIAAAEEARNLTEKKIKNDDNEETDEVKEERAFKEYIVAAVEQRAADAAGLTKTNNGSVIGATIVKRVISKVQEICPIFEKSTLFTGKGIIKIPVYDKDGEKGITVAYQKEFNEVVSNVGKFSTIDLEAELASALALVSESLIHNSDIDVVEYVICEMAKSIAYFIEKELLVGGTEGKCEGAINTSNTITAAKSTAVNADELIDLQAKIKTVYQKNACWTMHPETFTHIRKLKDGNQQYLFHTNGGLADGVSHTLLGKPVHLSDNMPKMEAGKAAILYGDYEGLGVKLGRDIQIKILAESFATIDAIGILCKFEIGSKIIDSQKLATITMAASA